MRSPRLAFVAVVAVAACTTQQARRTDTPSPPPPRSPARRAGDAAVRQAIEAANTASGRRDAQGRYGRRRVDYADDAILMMPNDQRRRATTRSRRPSADMVARAMKISRSQAADAGCHRHAATTRSRRVRIEMTHPAKGRKAGTRCREVPRALEEAGGRQLQDDPRHREQRSADEVITALHFRPSLPEVAEAEPTSSLGISTRW